MEYNRFDIVEAHYWYCAHYHGGQWSDLYRRLCRISEYFSPGCTQNGPSSFNSQMIYDNLVEKGDA